MRKLLFLDVDGVLNDLQVLSSRNELGEVHLKNLQMITSATQCDIILSSTWRLFSEHQNTLKVAFSIHNIPLWIDVTPRIIPQNLSCVPRNQEINAWLVENVNTSAKVVVVDDESDARLTTSHNLIKHTFIHTSMNTGLTDIHAHDIIRFFNDNF
jgi:hypothetical protein